MAYPRSQRSRAFKFSQRTAGNVTITTAALNIDTALDLTLAAQVGDVIEYAIGGSCTAVSGSNANFDVATIVSAAIVNYFGLGMTGKAWPGWHVTGIAADLPVTGAAWRTLVAGDLSSGNVTLRLRGYGGGTGSHILLASTTSPLTVFARNLGPVSPH